MMPRPLGCSEVPYGQGPGLSQDPEGEGQAQLGQPQDTKVGLNLLEIFL